MPRTTRLLQLSTIATALVLLAACGSSGSTAKGDATTSTLPAGPPVIKVGTTKLGPILVDANGYTLYVNDADPDNEARCVAELCAYQFPALVIAAKNFAVGPGLDRALFTTVPGLRGTRIAAVKRRPLYRCRSDVKPGQTSCQTFEHGTIHAVRPSGTAITTA